MTSCINTQRQCSVPEWRPRDILCMSYWTEYIPIVFPVIIGCIGMICNRLGTWGKYRGRNPGNIAFSDKHLMQEVVLWKECPGITDQKKKFYPRILRLLHSDYK